MVKLKYRLTVAAEQDYADILRYTLQTWGKKQYNKYRMLLRKALERVADHPALGKRRDELCSGCLSYPAGKHVIFYRSTDTGIEILRILHDSMDAQRHIGEE